MCNRNIFLLNASTKASPHACICPSIFPSWLFQISSVSIVIIISFFFYYPRPFLFFVSTQSAVNGCRCAKKGLRDRRPLVNRLVYMETNNPMSPLRRQEKFSKLTLASTTITSGNFICSTTSRIKDEWRDVESKS
ncbi:hypothetical protein GQX74_007090 [Glossina fuscipes]|nr:hypothetical protein GQX74_007090 [Glossina fuscipes]